MVGRWITRGSLCSWGITLVAVGVVCGAGRLTAQSPGGVQGTVTKEIDGTPLASVRVTVSGTGISTVTGTDGRYTLPRVPVGAQVILFRWLGYQPQQAAVTVQSGGTETVDATLTPQVVSLGEIIVTGASRTPERVVEAPAAVSVISPITLRDASPTGQAPRALATVPGVDIVQSGVTDFNVNARGFNSSLNRRILVLQDSRDLAIAFLGSQEWNSLAVPLEDIGRLEMVRGPGSALYGANAFSGVINITTPPARDVVGTKLSIAGGELSTFRGDLRHAGVSPDGRFGYRFNFGYTRSDTWSRSRTAFDGSDALAEYRDIVEDDAPVVTGVTSCTGLENCLPIEARTLGGQTPDATTGVASGDSDDIQNIYGSGRLDYYATDGSVFTVEGGAAQVENELFVTGIGRVQVTKALRPWARVAWDSDNLNLMAWYSGRNSIDPQFSLASGVPLEETSAIVHAEAQYNVAFAEDRGRIIAGASARNYSVDTKSTLMLPGDDDRSDQYYAGYGQVEFKITPQLRAVAAARVDESNLFDTQVSPKAALVFSPNERHAIRATFNRAFQTPNYSEFFLRAAAGAPTTSPATLEQGIEALYAGLLASPLAPFIQPLNLTTDVPWDFLDETPILALGNANLDVEKVTGWELGYKGTLSDRAYLTADLYYNRLSNFVTDLLPAVNQVQYPTFDLNNGVNVPDELARLDAVLEGAGIVPDPTDPTNPRTVILALQSGFAQLGATAPAISTFQGNRAIVVSYANAGKVEEYGFELGFGYGFTPEVRLDAAYSFFEFDVTDRGLEAAGQDIVPNTPQHKANLALTYTGQQGFDVNVNVRLIDSYNWSAGVFGGAIPSSQTVDLSAGYRINNNMRLFATATNLLDQERFYLYGGSVNGRRVLGGATATF